MQLRAVLIQVLRVLRKVAHAARIVLRMVLQIVLALLIVLEEWGWRPLADLLGRLAKWRPWAAVETFIAGLPPYAALIAFAAPSALLLPLKFMALLLIAKGYYATSVALFLAAKAVATALIARLFLLTQPKLMSIGWFAWGYERVMPWKEHLTEMVRTSYVWRAGRIFKERVRRMVRPLWLTVKPQLDALVRSAAAGVQRLTARVQAAIRDFRARRQ